MHSFRAAVTLRPMLRPSRPLTVWLLWLAIALLPMRAWAASTMSVAVVGDAVAVMAATADSEAPHAAGPCHPDSDNAGAVDGHSCGLCGVCHSAVVSLPTIASPLPALPSTSPPSDPDPGVERAVLSGLDRPPRIVLA